jgi:transcription antitermination protein NusB
VNRRHRAREIILEVLYRLEIEGCEPPEALERYQETMEGKDIAPFVERIINGVMEKKPELDATIDKYADKWSLNRMPVIDRNILRMSIYELENEDDVPASVTINEAVELANAYSTDDSGRFVNGVLGHIVKDTEVSAT